MIINFKKMGQFSVFASQGKFFIIAAAKVHAEEKVKSTEYVNALKCNYSKLSW